MVAMFSPPFSGPESPLRTVFDHLNDKSLHGWPQDVIPSFEALGQLLDAHLADSGCLSPQQLQVYLNNRYSNHPKAPQTKSQRRFPSSSSTLDSIWVAQGASIHYAHNSKSLSRRSSSGASGLERGWKSSISSAKTCKEAQIEVVEVDDAVTSVLGKPMKPQKARKRQTPKLPAATDKDIQQVSKASNRLKASAVSSIGNTVINRNIPDPDYCQPRTKADCATTPAQSSNKHFHMSRPKVHSKKATRQDCRKWEVPDNYSLKYWDPNVEPILLFQHALDANHLGIHVCHWTTVVYGAQSPQAIKAGVLWVSLVRLFDNFQQADHTIKDVRLRHDRAVLNEFIDSGERLIERFCMLLRTFEVQAMRKTTRLALNQRQKATCSKEGGSRAGQKPASPENQVPTTTSNHGKELAEHSAGKVLAKILFREDDVGDRVHDIMQAINLFNLRFEANCESILRDPKGMQEPFAEPHEVPGMNIDRAKLGREGRQIQTDESSTRSGIVPCLPHVHVKVDKVVPDDNSDVESPVASTPGVHGSSDDTDDDAVIDFLPFSESDGDTQISHDHPFAIMVPPLYAIALQEYTVWRTHHGGGQKQTKSASTKRRRSKTVEGTGDGNANDSGNDDNDKKKNNDHKRARGLDGSILQPEGDDSGPTLACPFYKHDKIRHSRCLYLRLKRIKDVKQHLRRCHAQPRFCPICGTSFEDSQESLDQHLIARTCEQQVFDKPEGVTDEHKTKFTQRVGRTLTLREQWFTVWDILFPDNDRPDSPFVEDPISEVCGDIISWWDRNGRDIVHRHIESHGGMDAFEEQLRNPERDLASLFVMVGRNVLTNVVEQMKESGEAIMEAESGLNDNDLHQALETFQNNAQGNLAASPQLTTTTTIEPVDKELEDDGHVGNATLPVAVPNDKPHSAQPLDSWQSYDFDQEILLSNFNDGYGLEWSNEALYDHILPAYVLDTGTKGGGEINDLIEDKGGIS